jgi:hypothetical protein
MKIIFIFTMYVFYFVTRFFSRGPGVFFLSDFFPREIFFQGDFYWGDFFMGGFLPIFVEHMISKWQLQKVLQQETKESL